MERRPLGALPIKASIIGFGSWALGGPAFLGGQPSGWGAQSEEESRRAIRRALDLGVNFFDTADVYGGGTSERLLGEELKAYPDAVICTKFGTRESKTGVVKDFSAEWLATCVDNSLKRLRRERLDILLLHSPPDDFDWSGYDSSPLEKLKSSGKIGGYGVSSRSYRGAENVLFHRFGDVIEAIYNLFDRRLEAHVFPEAMAKRVGVIARVPLASGFLTGKFGRDIPHFDASDFRSTLSAADVRWRIDSAVKLSALAEESGGLAQSALRFCFSHPAVSTVIPGMRSIQQVEENVAATQKGSLSDGWRKKAASLVPEVFPGWE